MSEFCDPDNFRVLCAKSETEYEDHPLRDLLPEVNYVAMQDGYGFKGVK